MRFCPLKKVTTVNGQGTQRVEEFGVCDREYCMWYVQGTKNCSVRDIAELMWMFAEGDRTLLVRDADRQ